MIDFSKHTMFRFAALFAVLLAIALYWGLCSNSSQSVFQGVPSQTALVLHCNGYTRWTNPENPENPFSTLGLPPDLSILQSVQADMDLATRVFKGKNGVQTAFNGNSLLAAFSLQPTDSLHGLYLVDLGAAVSSEKLWNLLAGSKKVFASVFKGQTLFTVHVSTQERFVVAVHRNLLLFSRFSYLLEDALVQLDERKSWWAGQAGFKGIDKKESPFQVIIRPEILAERWKGATQYIWESLPDWIAGQTEWIALLWTGARWEIATELKDNPDVAAKSTGADRQALYSIMPDNTALIAWSAISAREGMPSLAGPGVDRRDFAKYIQPWAGDELAYAVVEPFSPGMHDDRFVLIRVADSLQARLSLQEYGAKQGLMKQYDYQTFEVNQYLSRSALAPVVETRESAFQNPVSVLIGNYVVFASSTSAIELLIDKYIVNQTLGNLPDFLQLNQNLAAGGPALLFFNFAYLPLFVKNIFGLSRYEQNASDIRVIQNIGLLALDFQNTGNRNWAAVAMRQAQHDAAEGISILWKATLAGDAAGAPNVVQISDESGEAAILIQDDQHQLYRISSGGAVLWRKVLEQPILSRIYGIDYFKNGQFNFLFNTADAIWILDDQGREVEGFPLRLQSPATNGVTVIDFDNIRRYSLFVACENGNLYGFDQFGRPVSGWNPKSGVGRIQSPLVHFSKGDKDYLAVLSTNGRLSVFNRNGSPHFAALDLEGQFTGPLQADDNPKSARFVCQNTDGRLYVCNSEGVKYSLQIAPEGKGAPNLVFTELSEEDRKDYIISRGQTIRVSANDRNTPRTRFNLALPTAVDTLFQAGPRTIGGLNRAKRQIFLIEPTGQLHTGFPLAGTTPFTLNKVIPGRKENILLVGNQNSIYAYKIN